MSERPCRYNGAQRAQRSKPGHQGQQASQGEAFKLSSAQKESALRGVFRTYGLLQRLMQPHFQRFGITLAQWGVLRALDRAAQNGEEYLRLTELSERLLVQPPSVTGAVERLVKRGLIIRSQSAEDRRARELRLTAQGKALIERVLELHPERIREVLGGLQASEQKELQRILDKLNAHIETLLQ